MDPLPDNLKVLLADGGLIPHLKKRFAREKIQMTLKQRLSQEKILLAPGIYDALTGLIAEQAGAEAVYLSGAGIAYTRFGRPDIGLVSMNEVADTVAAIRDRITLPLVVDADKRFRQCAQRAAHRARL